MATDISGWTGDNGGAVLGRANNTLLVTINGLDASDQSTLTFVDNTTFSVPWYPGIAVDCLTALTDTGGYQFPPYPPIVVGCTRLPWSLPGEPSLWTMLELAREPSNVYLMSLAQVTFAGAGPHMRWRPGVMLFSITFNSMSTIATAMIDSEIPAVTIVSFPG